MRMLKVLLYSLMGLACTGIPAGLVAQCSSVVTGYPYREDFELSNGGWYTGGVVPDWAWGSPSKPVIQTAGSGNNCWMVGGLSGSAYNGNQASWLQAAPCFSFLNVEHPYVSFKIWWETEQRFDGASFQYSVDGGSVWMDVGTPAGPSLCLNGNWFNYNGIVYLQNTPFLNSSGAGWSGNMQTTSGSCQGGGGSAGWVLASHIMPFLAGEPSVKFRFTFASGSICNNYDGLAIDDIYIGEAPENNAGFSFACTGKNTVSFTNTSDLCPTTFNWNFDDPESGASNTSLSPDPVHVFSKPGVYNVSLEVSSPYNKPSTITKTIIIPGIGIEEILPADCETNSGGSIAVIVSGAANYTYQWNTSPPQAGPVATGLPPGDYTLSISGPDACPADTTIRVPLSLDCSGIYFPNAFSPNADGRNEGFGVLGGIGQLTGYRLSVYNRWGERVFYTNNPVQKWDGTVRGSKTQDNLFVWHASFSLQGGAPETRKGTVSLIR